jgi:hypothetical protein
MTIVNLAILAVYLVAVQNQESLLSLLMIS